MPCQALEAEENGDPGGATGPSYRPDEHEALPWPWKNPQGQRWKHPEAGREGSINVDHIERAVVILTKIASHIEKYFRNINHTPSTLWETAFPTREFQHRQSYLYASIFKELEKIFCPLKLLNKNAIFIQFLSGTLSPTHVSLSTANGAHLRLAVSMKIFPFSV